MHRRFATLWLGGVWMVGCSAVYAPGAPLDDAAVRTVPDDASTSTDTSVADASPPPTPDAADATTDTNEAPRLRVFVTVASYKGSDLGQPTGGATVEADRLCNQTAADFRIAGTYIAWLNTSKSLARDRLTPLGPWYDATKKQVVFARNPRSAQPPLIGIPGPDGEAPPGTWFAWTGADPSGSLRSACTDWTSGIQSGRFGKPSSPATWADDNEQPCGEYFAHLYCFETSNN